GIRDRNVTGVQTCALPIYAVIARQDGECAAPGCTSTHLEVHHRTPWSQGGATDLDNLIGLCPSCHRLAHRGMLHIRDDGYGGFRSEERRVGKECRVGGGWE